MDKNCNLTVTRVKQLLYNHISKRNWKEIVKLKKNWKILKSNRSDCNKTDPERNHIMLEWITILEEKKSGCLAVKWFVHLLAL